MGDSGWIVRLATCRKRIAGFSRTPAACIVERVFRLSVYIAFVDPLLVSGKASRV
jgi:hypothetical protein